jgi:hypothetical protein
MKTIDAINSFGSIKRIAQALGLTVQAIYAWGEDVPELRAYQLRDILARQNCPAEVGAGDTAHEPERQVA